MSFQQGLSGLNATAKALDTIGNNVSNAGTVGYKASNAQFADVYAASLGGGGTGLIGIGATLSRVQQQFTQGNVTSTSNPLDLAINGSGFYRVTDAGGTITYTRAGQFQLDKNGYIINPGGRQLTGYAADAATGTISPGNLVALQVVNTNIAPKVTSTSSMQLNLDSRSLPPSAMSSGSLTGGAALASLTPIAGTNNVLDLIVDGNIISVTIPSNATGYSPSELVTTLQSLINSALSGTGSSVTVSNSTGGRLMITSDSKGSLGSQGTGSTVVLNGLGGSAANDLLGAAEQPAAGQLLAGANLPTSVTIGSGESFVITAYDASGPTTTSATVSLPAGTYSTTDGPPSAFETMLQAAVDVAFPGPGLTLTVTASTQTQNKLQIDFLAPAAAAGDTVTVSALTEDVQGLFGPTTVAGKDNFNSISGQTSGTLTSGTALTTTPATTITGGTNDTLTVTVDGTAVSVTLAADVYDGTATNTLADLAADVQTKINNALIAASSTARVTVAVNSSNKLVISSDSAGTSSSVTLTGSGGTAAATLFGANPVVLAGNQTQSVNPLGFTASTAQTVYDSQGNPHTLSLYFVKTSQGNVWQMYTTLDGSQQQGPTTLAFSGSGALQTPMPITLPAQGQSYTFTSNSSNATTPDPLQFTLDLAGTTQYGVSFGVNTLNQDGYSSGQLAGISIGSSGIIQGRFSNGQSKNMGQIVLVSFNNPNGLQSLGGNQWAETTESGQPIPGGPGTGSLGLIQSAAVEESNVDLTAELVAMITQQRAYQANAQTIKTQDQVLQTLVNLR